MRRLALIVACCATMVAIASEAPGLAAANLGFEQWDEGRPRAWNMGPADNGQVTADCEGAPGGRCAVKVFRGPEAKDGFMPLIQGMPPGAAAGHLLKLSGRIRTEAVEGWAGLWMRVDARGTFVAFDNMRQTGPRGTTDWQRFEIALPIAAGAERIVFGTLLSGRGTAWFDDLAFTIDSSVAVPDLPRLPPRPVPSQALAPDEALALPAASDLAKRAQPIRSLFSDRFDDLQFLKPLLEGRRLVQLGESGHGVAEFNWMKVRLAKFLHQEMGFDVVAFESSLMGCDLAGARIATATPLEVMNDCTFAVWHTAEVEGLFAYLAGERKAGRTIDLAGFDIQNSGLANPRVSARIVEVAKGVDAKLAARIEAHEKRLYGDLKDADAGAMAADYGALALALAKGPAADTDRAMILGIQSVRSREHLVRYLAAGANTSDRFNIRDRGMAENVQFLLDRLYPGRKVVVWGHNFHIGHATTREDVRPMGGWLAQWRRNDIYTIGFYMGRGAAAWNDRKHYEIPPPEANTLEARLAGAGWRMSFVTTSGMDAPIMSREWGVRPVRIVPAALYDALIYIDTVTPPEYR